MHNKSNLLLLILFALTVGVVGWLGYQLTSQQDHQIKMSQINRSEQSLLLMQNNINIYVKSFDQKFSQLLSSTYSELEDSLKRDSFINRVIKFDKNEVVVFPKIVSVEQQQSGYQWLNSVTNTIENNEIQNLNSGWFTWYEQQIERYIFWIKGDEYLLFIEINNAMFMADFIHYLAKQPNIAQQSYLQLVDNIGRTFYHWGNEKLKQQSDFNLQKTLSTPLNGWSLRYYSNIQSLSQWSKYLFQTVIIGLILLMSIITYFLFLLKRREQNEAQQRLSFINQVTHELKTPLTNIRLHGELLERTLNHKAINDNSKQSLAIIQQESERLSRLINNVLNFNSIEKKKMQLIPSSVDFNDLLNQAILPFQPSFQALKIEIKIQDGINQAVNLDIDVFKQIIGNLLSNIEKYAPQSECVIIQASKNLNSNELSVTIQDQGDGIVERLFDKVFKPFYRIHSHLTDAAGSGLGLGISRDLARLHGGDLVLLKCDLGTCFMLTIKELNDD